MRKFYDVVGAALVKDGKILACRRSYGVDSVIHKLEFVGGKIEEGETEQQALMRECREELDMDIEVGEKLSSVTCDYPEYTVRLSVYLCRMLSSFNLHVHDECSWLSPDEMEEEDWAPADREFFTVLKKGLVRFKKAESDEEFEKINELATFIMHETFDGNTPDGQTDYMIEKFLTPAAMRELEETEEYEYDLVMLNGEPSGFYAHCPAHYHDPEYKTGTFLSKIYLMPYARGKSISSKIFEQLPKPVTLTVKKGNAAAINVYKHCGFRIVGESFTDIGGGFFMDDYTLELD